MRVLRWMRRAAVAVTCVAVAGVAAGPAVAAPRTWYVGAGAQGGDGSKGAPLGSLAAVEQASAPGDTIVVLAAASPLDGGIALKPGQKLVGDGSPVSSLDGSKPAPRIANTSAARHSGDAVTLADDSEVANIAVVGANRGGIYGQDVKNVHVHDNDVTATNTSCTTGFIVQPFKLPSLVPGVYVPFSSGLSNGWAGIMIDETHTTTRLEIDRNQVHDSGCADGIDVRASGTADVTVRVEHNNVARLKQDVSKESVLAIGMQTTDTATLTADLDGNTETYIGTAWTQDEGEADSEGLFANAAGRSKLVEGVERNTFAHGLGHLSANCFEVVASNGGPTMEATLTNSTCDYVVGDILEAANLAENAKLTFNIDHVRAAHSTFVAAQPFHQVEPGDDGDCLMEIASGAGSTTDVNIRNSLFTDCVADGIGVVSSVADGSGAVKHVGLDLRNSRIVSNKISNLRVANTSPIEDLAVHVERTDLSQSNGTPVFLENLDTSGGTHAKLDLGGGALRSAGHNCIFGGGQADVITTRYDLDAKQDWWGVADGPATGRVVAADGAVNSTPALGGADCGPVAGTVLGPLPEGPATAACKARHVVLRLPHTWRRATVTVGGRRVHVARRNGRLTAVVRLSGSRGSTVTVRARGIDRSGRRVQLRTRYSMCAAG